MTKKTTNKLLEEAAVALEKQKAELAKLRPLVRGERLRSGKQPQTRYPQCAFARGRSRRPSCEAAR